ncbi:MAG: hypothetical protein KAT77_02885 [Nanoarchaeota archaeon]|nr:hypothetical protein [Nanoarchaeota archaeon]
MKRTILFALIISTLLILSACQGIVCNEPYIRFADSCCLDQNENNICDDDESGVVIVKGKTQEGLTNENPIGKINREIEGMMSEAGSQNCETVEVQYTEQVKNGTKRVCDEGLADYEITEIACESEPAEPMHDTCGAKDYHRVAYKIENNEEEAITFEYNMGAWINNAKFKFNDDVLNVTVSAKDDETIEAIFCRTGVRGACWYEILNKPFVNKCRDVDNMITINKTRTEVQCD